MIQVWLSAIIALSVLAFAAVMALTDHAAIAATLVAIDLVGLTAVFVIGRRYQSRSSSQEPEAQDE